MISRVLDLFWPRVCAICGRPSDRPGRYVCSDCVNRLPFVPTDGCCRQCGRAAEKLAGDFLCADCRTFRPQFDRVASALSFDAEARELVNAYKFRAQLWLRNDFADWLEAIARVRFKVEEIEAILPVPVTCLRRWTRGYNQSGILATALARRLNRPAISVLSRMGSPRRQSELDEQARRTNVVGTFRVRRPDLIRGKTVLVVDDIMTTGSTLSECARVLKDAGARRVWGLTLARSLRA